MRRSLLPLVAVVGVVMLIGPSVPAINFGSSGSAGTSGTTNGVWRTNNDNFVVAMRSLTFDYAGAINWAMTDFNSGADLTASATHESTCSDAARDTCAYDSDYGNNGFTGWNACAGTTSGSHPYQTCSLTYVKFNLYYPGTPPTFRACHELGHSLGLRHTTSSTSCMVSGGSSNTLNSHDKGHLILEYP